MAGSLFCGTGMGLVGGTAGSEMGEARRQCHTAGIHPHLEAASSEGLSPASCLSNLSP